MLLAARSAPSQAAVLRSVPAGRAPSRLTAGEPSSHGARARRRRHRRATTHRGGRPRCLSPACSGASRRSRRAAWRLPDRPGDCWTASVPLPRDPHGNQDGRHHRTGGEFPFCAHRARRTGPGAARSERPQSFRSRAHAAARLRSARPVTNGAMRRGADECRLPHDGGGPMSLSTLSAQWASHWVCRRCEVEGQSAEGEPRCWNCGGSVRIKFQVRVSANPPSTSGVGR